MMLLDDLKGEQEVELNSNVAVQVQSNVIEEKMNQMLKTI
jgi:hypothetical protein